MKIEIKENEIYLDDVKYVKAVPTQNFENNKKNWRRNEIQ